VGGVTQGSEAGDVVKRFPTLNFSYRAAAFVYLLTLLGSHLATPLYPYWQTEFSLPTAAITLIFACYPIGVTVGLLWGGRLGDQFGRKPLILVGVVLTALGSSLYLIADGMNFLVAARLLNGVAIGLMSGPAMAAVVESHPAGNRAEGSRFGSMITLASPAFGLLMASLVVHFAATPARAAIIPFLVQLCGLGIALLLYLTMRETILPESRRTLRTASYAPQGVWVPAEIRVGFIFAALIGVLVWANTGLWLALGPSMVLDLLGSTNRLLAGMVVVVFLATAGVVQIFARGLTYRSAIMVGLVLIPVSLILINLTLVWQSTLGLVVGAVLAGAGQGLGWMGSSEFINRITPTNVRASVLSAIYICGYFGTAIPLIAVGYAADRFGLGPALGALSAIFFALSIYLIIRNLQFRTEEMRTLV